MATSFTEATLAYISPESGILDIEDFSVAHSSLLCLEWGLSGSHL